VTDAELAGLVRSPFSSDALSADGVVVVTSADGTTFDESTRRLLTSLPVVVIGLDRDAAAPPAHTDLVVDSGGDALDAVLATVEANPIASTSLAVLLRGNEERDIGAGLTAESAVYSTLQAGPEFGRWRAAHPPAPREREVEPAVIVERAGARLTLTLDRPHVRNALNVRMRDELVEALAVAACDPSVDEVVLRGAGTSFCSGGDLDEFGSFPDPATAHLVRLSRSPARAIAALADRLDVRLHGACFGSGIELAAFARRVAAAPDTAINLPEIGLGLIPGAGGTVSLPRRIGRHRTALLALAGRSIDAPTALDWGLIDAVV
jgi:hypothetical protein